MTVGLDVPSVSAIREGLATIQGAFRDEPIPEDSPVGSDPAIEIERPNSKCVNDPESGDASSPAPIEDAPNSDASPADDGMNEEPEVIFEVPPNLTDADIRNALGEAGLAELQRLQQIRGIDALGWYVNFHQRRAQHGIYIPVEGVLVLAAGVLANLPVPAERKLELAFHAILRHELFHFATDCMVANWELTTGQAVYWTAKDALRNANGYVEKEEALANAYMLRGFKHPSRLLANSGGASKALHAYSAKQPPGYDEGPYYARSRSRYVEGCRDLAMGYQHRSRPRWLAPSAFDALLLYADPFRIDWSRCPIFITDRFDLQRLLGIKIEFFQTLPYVEETEAFRKELKKLDRFDVLILDDIGYVQQSREEMEVLFTFLAERYEKKSVIITSNLVFSQWDQIFKDPMTTMAAIDRLVHHAVILEFTGDSHRVQLAKAKTKT
jgi:hypothetical protein